MKTLYHGPSISFRHLRRRKVYWIGWAYQTAFWLTLLLIGIHALEHQNSTLSAPRPAALEAEQITATDARDNKGDRIKVGQ